MEPQKAPQSNQDPVKEEQRWKNHTTVTGGSQGEAPNRDL